MKTKISILIFCAFLLLNLNTSCFTDFNEIQALSDLYNLTYANGWTWKPFEIKWFEISTPDPCIDKWTRVDCSIDCNIVSLKLSSKNLTGKISSKISDIESLATLDLSANSLTGTIPVSLFSMSNLLDLSLSTNNLSGSIPEMYKLKGLVKINLARNRLNSTLPADLTSLTKLTFIRLASNQLSGSLPFNIGDLKNLTFFATRSNKMTNTIPSSIVNLKLMDSLGLHYNFHNGTVPQDIGKLTNMLNLAFSNNQLSGKLPNSIGNMTKVSLFLFESNRFTGTIPSSISKLTQIRNLFLNTNSFTGTLPRELLQSSSLQVLLVHNNKLSGSLDFGSSNSSLSYSIIDISNNRLDGDLPFDLFKRAKNLTVFSASSNCFQNSIPVSICDSYRLENLFLSSLSSECKGSNLLGSIPSCLFKMPNLQSLYLSSNKLSGSIPSGILIDSPKLVNLSVSYNNLRGTIPETLITNMLALLDVGNNKISGTVSDAYNINNRSAFISSSSRALELNDNRISGAIPVASINQYQKVSILRGNLFGCEEKIPSGKDDFQGIIICGSRDLDRAIYFLCSTIFLFVVYYIMKHPRFMPNIPFQQLFELISKINNWVNSIDSMLDENDKFSNTKSFMRCIREVERIILSICITYTSVILILIPILKSFPDYSTHTYQYNWLISLAFLSGLTPALIIFFLWVIFLVFTVYKIYEFHKKESSSEQSTNYQKDKRKILSYTDLCFKYMKIIPIVLINFVILAIVNFLYVYAQFVLVEGYHILVELALSVFNILYLILLGCSSYIIALDSNVSKLDKIRIRFFLLLLRAIITPLIATLFTDSNCFYEYVVPPKRITSTYSYPVCNLPLGNGGCGELAESINVQSIQPPFIYSSICTSALQINYIPIITFVYTLFGILTPLSFLVVSLVDPSKLPKWVYGVLPGMLWPPRAKEFKFLFKADIMISSQMVHLSMMLTFGMASPALAAAIFLVVVSEYYTYEIFIGRYLFYLKALDQKDSAEEISKLENELLFVWRYPKCNIVLLILVSSIFFGMVCFDIASDKVELLNGAMFVIIALIFGALIYTSFKVYYRHEMRILSSNNRNENTVFESNSELCHTSNILHEKPKVVELKNLQNAS